MNEQSAVILFSDDVCGGNLGSKIGDLFFDVPKRDKIVKSGKNQKTINNQTGFVAVIERRSLFKRSTHIEIARDRFRFGNSKKSYNFVNKIE